MASLYETRLIGKLYGASWINVIHFAPTGSQNTTKEDMAFSYLNSALPAFMSQTPRNMQFSSLVVSTPLEPNVVPLIIPINLEGTGSGDDELIPTVAYIMQKRSNLTGRAHRGRNYFTGVWKGDYKFGVLGPQGQARWDIRLNMLRAAYVGQGAGTFNMVIKHRDEGWDVVTELGISPTPGQMRSRGVGVGQ